MKPFIKRQKNVAADAEAICEAAQRPNMRFAPVKSEETQGAASVFRVRELLIRQRTQASNALRGHLAEYGWVVPQGATNARRLVALVADEESGLPATARASLTVLTATLVQLDEQIETLDAEIGRRARESAVARRLMAIPGIGPLIATAIATLAPPPEMFRQGRDFSAWLGLAPHARESGTWRGTRRMWGARRKVREALYIAALSPTRRVPAQVALRGRMLAAGKAPKTILIAVVRKLLFIFDAMSLSAKPRPAGPARPNLLE